MRLAAVKKQHGGMTVLVVLALPLLAAGLALLVDLGRIAVARSRLAAAADLAAYAGAASLADSLNRIAAANRDLEEAFAGLEADFAADSQQDAATAEQRIRAYEEARDGAISRMQGVAASMAGEARVAAAATFAANAPQAAAEVSVVASPELEGDARPEEQWRTLTHSSISGDSFVDPASVDEGSYHALRYLVKRAEPDALVGITATAQVQPMLLRSALGDSVLLQTVAAGQAFGGSVEAFALEGEDDALYRATIVPSALPQDDAGETAGVWP